MNYLSYRMKLLQRTLLLSFAWIAGLTINAAAQQFCGTKFSARDIAVLRSIPVTPFPGGAQKPTTTVYAKIQFHIVCSGDISTAPITPAQLNSALTAMNVKFANSGVQFTQCKEPRYVLFSPYSQFNIGDGAAENALGKNDIPHTINIYVNTKIPGYGGYTYFLFQDRIYMAADGFDLENGIVLSHEMGHFFGLAHTNGSGAAGSTTELVNGSNSATAGDFIQDTPADPAQYAYVYANGVTCVYPYGAPTSCPGSPNFCDANGQIYQPLGHNLMFPAYCVAFNTFTLNQLQKIASTYTTYFTNKYVGGFDLISKDHPDDKGYEPTQSADWIWVYKSPDIWNCRNPSNCTDHQEPGYLGGATTNNYLRVRVLNDGCVNSDPATLRTYWTLGSTGETWPGSWTTQNMCGGLPAGRELPNPNNTFGQTIPSLAPGQDFILNLPWDPIDPTPYTCLPLLSNGQVDLTICVLSRIESPQDPMFDEVNGPIDHNVRFNNNIVTRNTKLVPLTGSRPGRPNGFTGGVLVQNPYASASQFDLHFTCEQPRGNYFSNGGGLIMTLSDNLWAAWTQTGNRGNDVQVFNANLHQVAVTGNNGVLQNVGLEPGVPGEATFEFFLNTATTQPSENIFSFYQSLNGKQELAGSACIFDVMTTPDGPVSKPGTNGTSKAGVTAQHLITLYPNPVQQNKATIQLTIPAADMADLYITDLTGKKIMELAKAKAYAPGSYSEEVDFTNYPNGIYFLRINMKSGAQTIKFSLNR